VSRILTLLHDPATLISVGLGLLILLIVILVVVVRNKIKLANSDSVESSETEKASSQNTDNSLAFLRTSSGGTSQTSTPPADTGIRYNAMVFTEDGIKFKTIKEKLLTLIYCDPSMPKHGSRYLCVEKDGVIKGYDPRDTLIESKDTAHRAWRATHCYDIVRAMFATPLTGLEKLNQVFMWVFCGGLLFLGIIALSRI
jgi:hypothetical protein